MLINCFYFIHLLREAYAVLLHLLTPTLKLLANIYFFIPCYKIIDIDVASNLI